MIEPVAPVPTEAHVELRIGEYVPLYPNPQTAVYGVYDVPHKYYVLWATASDLPVEGEIFIDKGSAMVKFQALTKPAVIENPSNKGKGKGKGKDILPPVASAAMLTNEEFRQMEVSGEYKNRLDDFKKWWMRRKDQGLKEQFCSKADDYYSYGRAQLRNVADLYALTLKERLVNPWRDTFVHAQGWMLNFWEAEVGAQLMEELQHDSSSPICMIDMRTIFAVTILRDTASEEGAKCPWEVHLNFQTGYLPFRVKDELTARAWKGRIMKAIVEAVKVNQYRDKLGELRAGMEEVDVMAVQKDPRRMERCKKLWMDAIRSVSMGVQPNKKIYFELYRLYSETGDGNGDDLTMGEIELMAKEFIDMKLDTVKAVTVQQEKLLYSTHRPITAAHESTLRTTVETGRNLLNLYEKLRDPSVFLDRVVSFHSRTDISREGTVDINEFMLACPVFLMPTKQLKAESRFFACAARSHPEVHDAVEKQEAQIRLSGKSREHHEAEPCVQQ